MYKLKGWGMARLGRRGVELGGLARCVIREVEWGKIELPYFTIL